MNNKNIKKAVHWAFAKNGGCFLNEKGIEWIYGVLKHQNRSHKVIMRAINKVEVFNNTSTGAKKFYNIKGDIVRQNNIF